jgi:hypothetical protein
MDVSGPPAAGEQMVEEKSVLRWGGVAGMLSSILTILFLVILIGFVPAPPSDPEALVARFPEVRVATIVGQAVYLAAVILWIILFLALHRALRGGSLAPALFGSGVGLLGLVLFAAGGIPAVALSHISDLYHAPGATAQDRATLALVWQGIQAVFNETDTVGFVFLTLGYTLLGIAMLRNPTFGTRFGGVSIVLGLASLAGIALFSVASALFVPFVVLVFIILPLLLGWKVFSLSKAA